MSTRADKAFFFQYIHFCKVVLSNTQQYKLVESEVLWITLKAEVILTDPDFICKNWFNICVHTKEACLRF